MPTRTPTLVGPPSRDDVMTSALPRPPIVPMDDAVTSALLDRESVLIDLPYSNYTVQRSSDNVSFFDSTNTVINVKNCSLYTS